MAICQFFLQGRCRFGDKCWNEHPRGGGGRHQAGAARGGGGWGAANQRYTNVIQPSAFKSSAWGGGRDPGRGLFGSSDLGSSGSGGRSADFSQNRFSALSNQNVGDGYRDEEERLLECIVKDMEIWESSGQWMFSCYSPMKDKPNITGFQDISPEELRLECYNCRANNNAQTYLNSVQHLAKEWKDRLLQLKALNASTKVALLSELKNAVMQPLPSFGFGGQQTSSFGVSNFPVNSSSNSASNFSFKTSSSLLSASSGNTPAFGSSSAGCSPPAFGAMSSTSVSHPAGFGGPSAPSAASFSFKLSETTSGFGTSGFSGFGSSSTMNSSGSTPLPAFGAFSAAAQASPSHSSSTLFGQTASASAHNVTPAPSALTNSGTADKLFTPKSELTAEELKQFEAKRFMMGKIPLKPPPLELLNI
ncbi:nucleoporin NUP42 isoform X1 [Cygnus atratus]|uniref:nucleoporin NUP42 isoform X1 n=1 Tax=Cygnus atratus TaxID=8868 RepID=UPI0015D63A09|nr:nucleoporin NUP42 isoform X1 [Cygnus atratus]